MKNRIAAFMGVKGSGKDYQLLKTIGKHKKAWKRIDFKDGLIEMCEDILGYKIRSQYEEFKETIVGITQMAHMTREQRITFSNGLLAGNPAFLTGRKMLQNVGTEAMRSRDPDYWVKEWQRKAREALADGFSVACADCRFKNEMMAIQQVAETMKVKQQIRFCNYKSDRYDPRDPHASESAAQALLRAGFKDGMFVTMQDVITAEYK